MANIPATIEATDSDQLKITMKGKAAFLDRQTVMELIPCLVRWLETGRLTDLAAIDAGGMN